MKNSRTTAFRFCAMAGCAAILASSSTKIFAIEGLKISIQNSVNVVLGWPSATNETYIIQSIPALDSTNGWQTLTNFYPAFPNTNWTTYVISNAFSLPSGGGGTNGGSGGGGPPPMGAMVAGSNITSSETSSPFPELEPDDIMLPPSPWIPETLPSGAILKTDGRYVPLSSPQSGGTASPDNGSSGGSDPGFYLVVQDGVTCVGLTNGSPLSGTITIPLEIAVPNGDAIQGAALYVDGNAASGGLAQLINGLWTFEWDTTTVANGAHQLSAEVVFYDYDTFPDVTNALSITVSNVISWPFPFSQVFGQGTEMWINVQSAIIPANYAIGVYDSHTNLLPTIRRMAAFPSLGI
jgi:hypothetical protein